MKTKFTFLFVSMVLAFGSCASTKPKPLDPVSITKPIQLTQLNLFIRSDTDVENKGKLFIAEVLPKYMEKIANEVKEKNGLTIDTDAFLQDVQKGSDNIAMKTLDFGGKFVVHNYEWKFNENESPRAIFAISYAIREDGTMPIQIIIKQDDPEYKPGKEYLFELPLHVKE